MLNRREFVSRATVALLLVPIAAACSSGGGGSSDSTNSCAGLNPTSSVALNHTHTVCILDTDLANPPAAGVTYVTSSPDPTHTVSLTAAQLSSINGGTSVTVTTSTEGNHSHQFVISKA
jgi:hypothetical protein